MAVFNSYVCKKLHKPARRIAGFTLAELLIVVAIIAVLVGIAIPVFLSQLEKSRQAVDQSTMRQAKSAMTVGLMTGEIEADTDYYYHTNGSLSKTSKPEPYGKAHTDASSFWDVTGETADGIPQGNVLKVRISSAGVMSYVWGTAIHYTSFTSSTFYKHSSERQQAFEQLMTVDNAQRLAADKEVLNSMASYFNGISVIEMEKILGETRFNQSKNGGTTMLFEYGDDGGGSIRLSNFDTSYTPYFSSIGYQANTYANGSVNNGTYMAHTHNYTDSFLFTSNETVGTAYKDAVFHNINIKYEVDASGKVYNTKVWVNGVSQLTSD